MKTDIKTIIYIMLIIILSLAIGLVTWLKFNYKDREEQTDNNKNNALYNSWSKVKETIYIDGKLEQTFDENSLSYMMINSDSIEICNLYSSYYTDIPPASSCNSYSYTLSENTITISELYANSDATYIYTLSDDGKELTLRTSSSDTDYSITRYIVAAG